MFEPMSARDQPEPPRNIAALPRDRIGRHVPWFVHWPEGGEPDFRVIGAGRVVQAVNERRCWVCGRPSGAYRAFTVGPMCGINRVSSEPPAHRDCAVYSAQVCPFLTTPIMRRRTSNLPVNTREPAGIPILRNPGVTLIWVTKHFHIDMLPQGPLFRLGDPIDVLWYACGRLATRAEVMATIESGLPILRKIAEQGGQAAVIELEEMAAELSNFLPAA